jgi:hypothetical protein
MVRTIDDVLAEERIRRKPNRWCEFCRTWHFDECRDEYSRPWWDRLDQEMTFADLGEH